MCIKTRFRRTPFLDKTKKCAKFSTKIELKIDNPIYKTLWHHILWMLYSGKLTNCIENVEPNNRQQSSGKINFKPYTDNSVVIYAQKSIVIRFGNSVRSCYLLNGALLSNYTVFVECWTATACKLHTLKRLSSLWTIDL